MKLITPPDDSNISITNMEHLCLIYWISVCNSNSSPTCHDETLPPRSNYSEGEQGCKGKSVEHGVSGGHHHDHLMGIREQNCHVNSLPACIVTPIIHRITWARSTSYQVRQNSLLLQINWSSSTIARYPCNLDVDCCASALHVQVTQTLELTRLWVCCVLSWSDECASSGGMGGDRCIHVHLCWMKIGSLRWQANSHLVNMSWILKPTCTIIHIVHRIHLSESLPK